ncbi:MULTISPECIES: energy transducer TonB [unclassified Halobacteriovorax]|uniref:energy transducer TonB family protein n=1 Tax=unclassified Halobacteriovorax TaxID=2639665 RepID=UPI00399A60D2
MELVHKNHKTYIYLAIALSLVVHISLMPSKLTSISLSLTKPQEEKEPERIRLRLNRDKPRQIVTAAKTNQELADDAKYLSETNNKVDRETKAMEVAAFNIGGVGNSKIDQKKQGSKTKKKEQRKMTKSKSGRISFEDFAVAQNSPLQKDQNLVKGTKTGSKNHRGIASSNDHLEDVKLGDFTKLNTVEYKYYGFYFRIKQQLEQHWGATLREKMESLYRQNRRGPAGEKFLTNVRVVLDNDGKIINVIVNGTSGVKELDDAAVEAFNKAGPFPNPPSGLVKNGHANIDWGFAVTKN